jgi:serine/threonine protein kinase
MSIEETFTDGSSTPQEPIPGYRLLERLGRGGYGEVWKTLAPGGVPKAIKLIYGDDPARMATELRALNRIKDVRHPFLLSIERIEHRGELLAIVTELGDNNLQQHFQSCLNKGLPGIPQNDLLGMMRDVADVLDYIYQEHALQHLDIKPANLLQFGKRLKVADFGLVKNIYERSASLVHGLTPTYAAPEIFEGKPTRASDQYSLAVLYQEMLTGVLPFNGATAARLATQHLREAPDLRPLPATQQPVIARALSKDPNQRYSSCMELVQELTAAASRSQANPAAVPRNESSPLLREVLAKRPSEPISASQKAVPTQSSAACDTAQPPRLPSDQETIPTILIGIGGAAGKALQGLRLRIADRLGGVDKLTAFKMLFLDIDNDTLNELNRDHQTCSDLETIVTPLHSPSEYREHGQLHRRWLSRRWLFNVPRNLRTEGLRPLGRLALMTNANRVLASLRSAILHVTSSLPGKCPRILLVSSISGGTGSGMLPDVAYAARHELRNAGFPEAPVEGLLLHSTPVGTGRDKAVLNAIATLHELAHYSASGNFYPGEPLLQIPPFHGNNQTFTSTQFFHLGEGVDSPTWLRGIENVAELLYCRLLTNLDPALNGSSPPESSDSPSVDLVQMQQIGGYSGSFVDDLTCQLCVDVIDGWCGAELKAVFTDPTTTSVATRLLNSMEHSQTAKTQQLIAEAEKKVLECGVDVEQLLKCAREMLHQQLMVSQQDYLKTQFTEALSAVNDDVPNHEVARLTIALQDQSIGLDFGERRADSPHNTLFDLLHSRLTSQAMPIAGRYIGWICELIDQPNGGIDTARHAAEAGRNCIRDLIGVLGKDIRERQTRQTNSRIRLTALPTAEDVKSRNGWLQRRVALRTGLAEKLIEHGLCSFEELLDVLVHWQLRTIEASLSALIDQLLSMWQELNQLGKRFGSEIGDSSADGAQPTRYEKTLRNWLIEHRLRLVHELRTRIDQHILTGPKKLQRLLLKRGSYEQVIGNPLRQHARQIVLRSMDQLLCTVLQLKSQGLGNQDLVIDPALAQILREPWTIDAGSSEQAIMMVPAATSESTFHSTAFPDLPRVPMLTAKINNVAVCRRRCHVPLQDVIEAITHGQTGLLSIAANLHTRIDVEWTSPATSPTSTKVSERTSSVPSEVPQTVPMASISSPS